MNLISKKTKIFMMIIYNNNMRKLHEDIGICYITAFLRSHGYEVALQGVEHDMIDYEYIRTFAPQVIGLTSYDVNKESVIDFCRKIKRILPDALVCVGGNLPTYYGYEFLAECSELDIAIRGEGEMPFLELVNSIEGNRDWKAVKGLTYRDEAQIRENESYPLIEDLNTLPYPARDLISQNNLKIVQISSTRGCTGHCTFCASQLFWKKWRGMDTDRVISEIKYLKEKYGIDKFNFIDGSFDDPGGESTRYLDIAKKLISEKLNIFYYVHLQADFHKKATPEIMGILKESGLCSVCIGIESGNEEDLKLYGKRANLNDIEKTVNLLREYDIAIEPGFINFNPYSSFDRLRENIDFLHKMKLAKNIENIGMHYHMSKGTALYNKVKMDNLLDDGFYGYRYVFRDSRIKPLMEYVKGYLSFEFKQGRIFKPAEIIIYYTNKNFAIITYYKRIFNTPQFKEAYKLALKFETDINAICNELNDKIACWFRALIDLAENGWSTEQADAVSEKTFSKRDLEQTAMEFLRQKSKYYKSLVRLGVEYQKYFLAYD